MNKNAYQLYGFTPLKINGKYTAVCHVCGKNLQNTTTSRLKLHRNVCKTLEETFIMNSSENAEENNEETVNPLEIVHDTDVKKEASCERNETNVDEPVSDPASAYDINIEHYMNYMTGESPELQKSTTKRKNGVPPTTSTKKRNERTQQLDYNTLSNLRNQKIESEINYLKSKTRFYAQEAEKVDFARTFMLLKMKKLRLDIAELKR